MPETCGHCVPLTRFCARVCFGSSVSEGIQNVSKYIRDQFEDYVYCSSSKRENLIILFETFLCF